MGFPTAFSVLGLAASKSPTADEQAEVEARIDAMRAEKRRLAEAGYPEAMDGSSVEGCQRRLDQVLPPVDCARTRTRLEKATMDATTTATPPLTPPSLTTRQQRILDAAHRVDARGQQVSLSSVARELGTVAGFVQKSVEKLRPRSVDLGTGATRWRQPLPREKYGGTGRAETGSETAAKTNSGPCACGNRRHHAGSLRRGPGDRAHLEATRRARAPTGDRIFERGALTWEPTRNATWPVSVPTRSPASAEPIG